MTIFGHMTMKTPILEPVSDCDVSFQSKDQRHPHVSLTVVIFRLGWLQTGQRVAGPSPSGSSRRFTGRCRDEKQIGQRVTKERQGERREDDKMGVKSDEGLRVRTEMGETRKCCGKIVQGRRRRRRGRQITRSTKTERGRAPRRKCERDKGSRGVRPGAREQSDIFR